MVIGNIFNTILNTKTKKIELFKYLPVTKLISFNYTDTYTRMYKETNTVHYIHGFAAKDRIKKKIIWFWNWLRN